MTDSTTTRATRLDLAAAYLAAGRGGGTPPQSAPAAPAPAPPR